MRLTLLLKQGLTRWLERVWYGSRPVERTLLLPLSVLFCYLAQRRRERLTATQQRHAVPVIIMGNIAVGGTGKTPLTIALVKLLQQAGYRPGVVSRGYGAKATERAEGASIRAVTRHSKAEAVGDEALLMLKRTGAPLVVGAQRVQAVEMLLTEYDVDIVLSDDGLQHYRLARDLEIAVLDGERRHGNGYCLPAGPLREPIERLDECDFVVSNGKSQVGEYGMCVEGNDLMAVADSRHERSLNDFTGQQVHVVTAIGNPQRFFDTLAAVGIRFIGHCYPDHHLFAQAELVFNDDLPVLMTEKDAVKCQHFPAGPLENCWYLPVSARLDPAFTSAFLQRVRELTECAGSTGVKQR